MGRITPQRAASLHFGGGVVPQMGKRRHNPRVAKSLRCYSIIEVAELYGVHRQTVRHWLNNGLSPLDGGRPILIHGSELNRFHNARRNGGKLTCGPGELFCLGCRKPRRPAFDMADFVPITESIGTLSAICPTCGRMMTQKVNAERLARFSSELALAIQTGSRTHKAESVMPPELSLGRGSQTT